MARSRPHRSGDLAPEDLADEVDPREVLPKPRVPRVRGTRVVTAMLPNGTVAWLNMSPAPASASEINRLRRAVGRAQLSSATSLGSNALAVRRFAKRITRDTKRVAKAQSRGDRKAERRRVAGDTKLARRIERKIAREGALAAREREQGSAIVGRQRRRQLWDSIVVTSSTPLFAAYGQQSNPFAERNLTLTLSLGVWLLGDELTDLLSSSRVRRPAALRDVDAWSYVAPVGNFLTGWWLCRDHQHQAFTTGFVDVFPDISREVIRTGLGQGEGFPGPVDGDGPGLIIIPARAHYIYRVQIDLASAIAAGHIEDFRSFTDVPAVATLISSEWETQVQAAGFQFAGITAEVDLGVLTISLRVIGPVITLRVDTIPHPRVAWLVDTRDPSR